MIQARKVALVTGAHGLVGTHVARHLRDLPDWHVVTTSRREGPAVDGVDHVCADLNDYTALGGLPADVTHLYFAAYQPVADRAEEARGNVLILQNTVRALRERGAPVRHVVVYHGGKAYGAHLGPFKTPALETDSRLLGPLYYYAQEDLLASWAENEGIDYTIFRPDHICGVAFGPYVNLVHIVAVYACVTKELDQPLRFPGTEFGYRSLVQFTDAGLLARASAWAAQAQSARNEIFNISNGDVVRWVNTWPKVAEYFGLELGQPFPYTLAEVMADKGPVWSRIVNKYGLEPIPYEQMAAWGRANTILALERDLVSSTIKIRQAGFHDCMDSEESLFSWLDEMRHRKIIP